jgi:hypothetical protein
MGDWRSIEKHSQTRSAQKSGRGAREGLFQAVIDTSSGESQTGKMTYSGGSRTVPLVMPFDGTGSWIRSIPESGSTVLVGMRSDNEDVSFIRYLNDNPEVKLASYRRQKSLYRPLQPGEHEIHSTGLAQSYYSARPVLEQRGGLIRSWLDQDRMESGQKAPLHVRQLWEHRSNLMGDEERFGVVRRPSRLKLSLPVVNATIAKNLVLAGQLPLQPTLTSYNFSDYPYPDFTLPGGVPAAYSVQAQALAEASVVAGALTGDYKIRPYGKEYLRVIRNPLNVPKTTIKIPPAVLVDIREGQVFDNHGIQLVSLTNGGYLRAKHEYYTALTTELPDGSILGDSTKMEINELGDITWTTALASLNGWTTTVPLGPWNLTTGLGVTVKTLTGIDMKSLLGTSFVAGTSFDFTSVVNWAATAGLGFSTKSSTLTMEAQATANIKGTLGLTLESPLITDVKAGTLLMLEGPLVQIGSSPSDVCVLGVQLTTWLTNLVNFFVTNAASLCLGNLGAPAPLNPALVPLLTQMLATMPTFVSKTIQVSP